MTTKELDDIKKRMEAFKIKMQKNPNEYKAFLKRAGILNSNGKIASQYRISKKKK